MPASVYPCTYIEGIAVNEFGQGIRNETQYNARASDTDPTPGPVLERRYCIDPDTTVANDVPNGHGRTTALSHRVPSDAAGTNSERDLLRVGRWPVRFILAREIPRPPGGLERECRNGRVQCTVIVDRHPSVSPDGHAEAVVR